MLLRLLRGRGVSLAPQCVLSQSGRVFDNSSKSHGAFLVQFSSQAVTSTQDEEEKDAQRKLDDKRVRDRREWNRQLSELRKQFADDWEKLDKSLLKKTKLKRKKGYQPLNREALLESARKRWEENEERKAKLRALEAAWLEEKPKRQQKLDELFERAEEEIEIAKRNRKEWLLNRSEEWIPEEELDLAITIAILEPQVL